MLISRYLPSSFTFYTKPLKYKPILYTNHKSKIPKLIYSNPKVFQPHPSSN